MCYLFEGVSMGALMCVHMESVKTKSKRPNLKTSIQEEMSFPCREDHDEEMLSTHLSVDVIIRSNDTEPNESVRLASSHKDAR